VSPLQWALLLLGLGIVVLLVWSSRREKKALERMQMPAPPPASRDWGMERAMTIPAAPPARPEAKPASPTVPFDELGVGKPRKRTAPEISGDAPASPAPTPTPADRPPDKVVGLYIAEHEGTNILGPKIHAALSDRGLRYGPKKVYHRYDGDQPVFSVASLVKPGALDPAEAEGFATPGLSVFMVLPGPVRPVAAFQDMLDTARGLARALNAELYDSEQRAPLTPERERTLHAQVEDWARRYTPAGRLGV
jgi:cell division protein ZipA